MGGAGRHVGQSTAAARGGQRAGRTARWAHCRCLGGHRPSFPRSPASHLRWGWRRAPPAAARPAGSLQAQEGRPGSGGSWRESPALPGCGSVRPRRRRPHWHAAAPGQLRLGRAPGCEDRPTCQSWRGGARVGRGRQAAEQRWQLEAAAAAPGMAACCAPLGWRRLAGRTAADLAKEEGSLARHRLHHGAPPRPLSLRVDAWQRRGGECGRAGGRLRLPQWVWGARPGSQRPCSTQQSGRQMARRAGQAAGRAALRPAQPSHPRRAPTRRACAGSRGPGRRCRWPR